MLFISFIILLFFYDVMYLELLLQAIFPFLLAYFVFMFVFDTVDNSHKVINDSIILILNILNKSIFLIQLLIQLLDPLISLIHHNIAFEAILPFFTHMCYELWFGAKIKSNISLSRDKDGRDGLLWGKRALADFHEQTAQNLADLCLFLGGLLRELWLAVCVLDLASLEFPFNLFSMD
jgi:hypothetical protein